MAKFLGENEIIVSRKKVINDLESKVKSIRIKAERRNNLELDENKMIRNQQSNLTDQSEGNILSILGGRGFGKSSIAYTFLRGLDLEKENIVFDIIDPQKFKSTQDLMLWIIGYFVNEVDFLDKIEQKNNGYCTDKKDLLDTKFQEIKGYAVLNNSYSNKNLGSMSQTIRDLVEYNQQVSFSNVFFDKKWREFLDCFFSKYKTFITNDNKCKEKEPLLFITIDDADLSSEYGFNILTEINNYLRHPNIVVLVLGEYNEFYRIVYTNYVKESNISLNELKGVVVKNELFEKIIADKTKNFLKKIIGAGTRYELPFLDLEERMEYRNESKSLKDLICLLEIKNQNKSLVDYLYFDEVCYELGLEKEYENMRIKAGKRSLYKGFDDDTEYFANKLYGKKYIPYAELLPDTPRDLKNLSEAFFIYSSEFKKKLVSINRIKVQKSKTIKDEVEKENFDIIVSFIKWFINNSKFKDDPFLDRIMSIRKNSILFDFKDIDFAFINRKIRLGKYFIPQDEIRFFYRHKVQPVDDFDFEEKYKWTLLDLQMTNMIQFIYDICKDFLNSKLIILNDKKVFSEYSDFPYNEMNLIYKRLQNQNDMSNIKIWLSDFQKFRDYYTFIDQYEKYIPIIEGYNEMSKSKESRLESIFGKIIVAINRFYENDLSKIKVPYEVDKDTLNELELYVLNRNPNFELEDFDEFKIYGDVYCFLSEFKNLRRKIIVENKKKKLVEIIVDLYKCWEGNNKKSDLIKSSWLKIKDSGIEIEKMQKERDFNEIEKIIKYIKRYVSSDTKNKRLITQKLNSEFEKINIDKYHKITLEQNEEEQNEEEQNNE